jgi:hypothetical protein
MRRGAGGTDHRRAGLTRPAAWRNVRGRGRTARLGDGTASASPRCRCCRPNRPARPRVGDVDDADPATRLLPPGFSTTRATDVVAVSGAAVNLDRGQLRDRLDATRPRRLRAAGREPPAGVAGGRLSGGRAAAAGRPGGGFALVAAGRHLAARRRRRRRWRRIPRPRPRQHRPQGSTTYTFGGSALDAAPYALRGAQTTPRLRRQQFGGSVGGPLRSPASTTVRAPPTS